jgi:hypothetical protein
LEWVRIDAPTHPSAVPLLFVGLPLADAFAAVVRRVRGKKSPFLGDRRHFYDLLLRRGWSAAEILGVSAVTTVLLVMLSLTAVLSHISWWPPVCVGAGVCGFLGLQLGSFDPETPAVGEPIPPQLEQI